MQFHPPFLFFFKTFLIVIDFPPGKVIFFTHLWFFFSGNMSLTFAKVYPAFYIPSNSEKRADDDLVRGFIFQRALDHVFSRGYMQNCYNYSENNLIAFFNRADDHGASFPPSILQRLIFSGINSPAGNFSLEFNTTSTSLLNVLILSLKSDASFLI